jgi:hypothetical protein
MKEKAQKKTTKSVLVKTMAGKKETGIEMLARLMVNGFEQLRQEFRQELKATETRMVEKIEAVKEDLSGVKEEVSSIKEEQKVQGCQITSIERKLEGTLLSLDETVHRSEFNGLVHRVEVLEK